MVKFSATEVRQNLADCIRRVESEGTVIAITQYGKTRVMLVPADAYWRKEFIDLEDDALIEQALRQEAEISV